ncbi:MAG: Uma2 family endonuclease [Aphanocapsa sp. GSE-SYN-MK-11-07L]|nr:Uma2 family endonuclease [Aphanocapsa sp. GSE-SYN-MK-11-07L]
MSDNELQEQLAWFDEADDRYLTSEERATLERQRADLQRQRAETEQQRRENLEAFLRSQGFDPDHTTPILSLPDHTQLPESDGTFVKNFQEHPQSILLTTSIQPLLDTRHPDGHYAIGQDCGIYWRLTEPPERGAEAPDWFYVPDVPPLLDGQMRRSYVMWKEIIAPLIVIEFVSGDGSEERDRTSPLSSEAAKAGKFWVYEQAIRAPFYAIYEVENAAVEVYELVANCYQQCSPNDRGHYPIAPLGVELGIWQGRFGNQILPWLRWWDSAGVLLPTGNERAEQERQRAERGEQQAQLERQRAEQERQRAETERQQKEVERQRREQLEAFLRSQGFDPDHLPE